MTDPISHPASLDSQENMPLFSILANEIENAGYSIVQNALPKELVLSLYFQSLSARSQKYSPAGIGRKLGRTRNEYIRTDQICWINDDTDVGQQWLKWAAELQTFLNRRLLLGLFSFESHFARYSPGGFYKKHLDAFKGETNRILSLVLYLNSGWQPEDGGELVLYAGEQGKRIIKVAPRFGTLVVFLSEDIPHQVLPVYCERYSVAGWFRVNCSSSHRADPPS
jgi:SM-20-related protein